MIRIVSLCVLALVLAPSLGSAEPRTLALPDVLAQKGGVEVVDYRGKRAIRAAAPDDDHDLSFVVQGVTMRNGTIDVDVAGEARADAPAGTPGFVGLAFGIVGDARAEVVYLRPGNARNADQQRRNHSTQYISAPEWTWQRLRKETPGVYESYVDLVPGAWTHMRLELDAKEARLFVAGAAQPTLIAVRKIGDPAMLSAPIALWVGPGTIAHFANLVVTPN
jgi:hypothetical protein